MSVSLYSAAVGLLVLLFVLGLLLLAIRLLRRAHGVRQAEGVEVFLERLIAVDRGKLQIAAAADATGSEGDLERWQVWELVGGVDGLTALSHNCTVLIDMVCYVQQWYPEALPVAEQLRLHAREIQWHIERLRGAESRGHLRAVFPDYAQRAVAIYCSMTDHVVALYEGCQAPGFQDLRAAL